MMRHLHKILPIAIFFVLIGLGLKQFFKRENLASLPVVEPPISLDSTEASKAIAPIVRDPISNNSITQNQNQILEGSKKTDSNLVRLSSTPISRLDENNRKVAFEFYEKSFPRDFNPFKRHFTGVLGTLKFSYKGFDIHFRIKMKPAVTWENGIQAFPLLFEQLENSTSGVSTAATLNTLMSMEQNYIILHVYTPIIIDVLEEKNNSEQNLLMRSTLEEISDIMVPIDFSKEETIVTARQNLDPNEVPFRVGSFRYQFLK